MSTADSPVKTSAYRGAAPGVYVSWRGPAPEKPRYRTDIAGFVGVSEMGPTDRALRLESWEDFVAAYGPPVEYAHLGYAVRGFFENGGRTCYVVRAVSPTALPAATNTQDIPEGKFRLEDDGEFKFGSGSVSLEANSVGAWANGLKVKIVRDPTVNLQIIEEQRGRTYDTYIYSMDIIEAATRQALELADSGSLSDVRFDLAYVHVRITIPKEIPTSLYNLGPEVFANAVVAFIKQIPASGFRFELENGKDRLEGLRSEHIIGLPEQDGEAGRGLALFEKIDEINLMAVPDVMMPDARASTIVRPGKVKCLSTDGEPSTGVVLSSYSDDAVGHFAPKEVRDIQDAVVSQCDHLRDRFALLDGQSDFEVGTALYYEENTPFAAVYFPWLQVPRWGTSGVVRALPPSGHVAGCIARRDRVDGVHAPPANLALENVSDVTKVVGDDIHGLLNELGVNVIAPVPGRGIRIMGARTRLLLGYDATYRYWRYINVRRLFSAIVEQIEQGTAWAVFEPHGPTLWRGVERTVRGLLFSLWRAGSLSGATADEAYFVRCDETTNPPEAQELGRVTCLVGGQPPWPAEFVVLRIGLSTGGADVETENGGVRA